MIEIAQRKNDLESFKALSLQKGPNESEHSMLYYEGNTAVINITGPIFRYANIFTEISGATSVSSILKSITEATDPANGVDLLVFNFDTPGGEATEIASLAELIHGLEIKTVGYVGAMAASAGYWLASATDEIVIGSTGMVGSIGVIGTFHREGDEEKERTIEIISSQSPDKRIDVSTDDGRAKMQVMIDKMADVFINDVAKYRGVSPETVILNFGQGGLKIGAEAVESGMADRIGLLESVLKVNDNLSMEITNMSIEERVAQLKAEDQELFSAIFSMGVSQGKSFELSRIKGVKGQCVAGYEAEIETMMFDGQTTPEQAALSLIKAMQDRRESFKADVGKVQPPIDDAPDEIFTDSYEQRWATDRNVRKQFSSFENFKAFEEGIKKGAISIITGGSTSK